VRQLVERQSESTGRLSAADGHERRRQAGETKVAGAAAGVVAAVQAGVPRRRLLPLRPRLPLLLLRPLRRRLRHP
jgi:hypothetical protein